MPTKDIYNLRYTYNGRKVDLANLPTGYVQWLAKKLSPGTPSFIRHAVMSEKWWREVGELKLILLYGKEPIDTWKATFES